jgi:hypothetical protein
MPGLVPGIHALRDDAESEAWMAGTSPAMTMLIVCIEVSIAYRAEAQSRAT